MNNLIKNAILAMGGVLALTGLIVGSGFAVIEGYLANNSQNIILGILIFIVSLVAILIIVIGPSMQNMTHTYHEYHGLIQDALRHFKKNITYQRRVKFYAGVALLSGLTTFSTSSVVNSSTADLNSPSIQYAGLVLLVALVSTCIAVLIVFLLVVIGLDDYQPKVTSSFNASAYHSAKEIVTHFRDQLQQFVLREDPTYQAAVQSYEWGHKLYATVMILTAVVLCVIHFTVPSTTTFNVGLILFDSIVLLSTVYLAVTNHEQTTKQLRITFKNLCADFHKQLRESGLNFKIQAGTYRTPGKGIVFTSKPANSHQSDIVDFIELAKIVINRNRNYRDPILEFVYLTMMGGIGYVLLVMVLINSPTFFYQAVLAASLVAFMVITVFSIFSPLVYRQYRIMQAKLVIGTYVSSGGSFG